jgi:outer membrane protein OmpA-like peptidoglycan-associated protein
VENAAFLLLPAAVSNRMMRAARVTGKTGHDGPNRIVNEATPSMGRAAGTEEWAPNRDPAWIFSLLRSIEDPMRRTRLAAFLLIPFLLTACETTEDVIDAVNPANWFEDDEVAQAQGGTLEPVPGASGDYPAIGTVPERPGEPGIQREYIALAEVLAADRENALYTDETIRRQSPPVRVGATGLPVEPPPEPPVATSITPPPEPVNTSVTPAPVPEPIPAPTPAPAPVPVPAASTAQVDTAPRAAPEPEPLVPRAAPPPTPATPPPPTAAQLAAAPTGGDSAAPEYRTQMIATIYFPDGGASLTERDRGILRQVAEIYRRDQGRRVVVVGHSSTSGAKGSESEQALVNYKVSLDRAAAVGQGLLAHGVALEEIVVDARGARQLKYSEETPAGEAGNRRAEIFLQY